MMFTIFENIIVFLISAFGIFLGVSVWNSERKKQLNFFFFLMTVSIITWVNFAYLGFSERKIERAILYYRINWAAVSLFLLFSYLLYIRFFLKIKNFFGEIIVGFISLILFILSLFSDLIIKDVIIQSWGAEIVFGPLNDIFSGFSLLVSLIIAYSLIKSYFSLKRDEQQKTLYFLIGTFLFVSLNIVFNIFSPLVFQTAKYQHFGDYSAILFLAFSGYAILKQNLFNVRVLIVYIFVGFIAILLLLDALLFSTTDIILVIKIFVFLIFLFFGYRLILGVYKEIEQRKILEILNRNLQQKTNDLETLRTITNYISSTLDLHQVAQNVVNAIPEYLGSDNGYIGAFLTYREKHTGKFRGYSVSQTPNIQEALTFLPGNFHEYTFNPEQDNSSEKPGIFTLIAEKKPKLVEHLCDLFSPPLTQETCKKISALLNIKTIAAFPILVRHNVFATIQFALNIPKEAVDAQRMRMMQAIADQLSIAISNAQAYRDLDEAREILRQLTEDLATIQNITNDIVTTLDFQELARKIVNDSIPNQLGSQGNYLGGILTFREKDPTIFRVYAVTRRTITDAINMPGMPYPMPFEDHYFSIAGDVSKALQTVLSDQIYRSENLADFLCPPVPAPLVPQVQKMIGMKSAIMFPIVLRGTVAGTLQFIMTVPLGEVNDREIDMMQAFANQVSIAFSNARSYLELQEANERVKKAKADLQVAYEELQELDKAKMEFLSIASHQLRTPISVIRGYVSMLAEGDYGPLTEKEIEVALKAKDNVIRLADIVEDILGVSHLEAGKLEINLRKADITQIAKDAVEEVQIKAEEKGIELNFIPPTPPPPTLTIDEKKISQVLVNLVDNAVHYTEKGSVTLSMQVTDTEVSVTVQDTGIGIPEEFRKTLFQKFARAENAKKLRPDGSGIGMYLVKNIVERHGGVVSFESVEGQGTTFVFTLPIAPGETVSQKAEKA